MEMILITKEELNTMLSENIGREFSSLLKNYNLIPRNVKNKTNGKSGQSQSDFDLSKASLGFKY